MSYFIFGIIMLHLIVGFGWVIYKIGFQKTKPEIKDNTKSEEAEN